MGEIKQTGLMLDEKIVEEARIYAKEFYNTSLSGVVRAMLHDFVDANRRLKSQEPDIEITDLQNK